jgi:hypothetical protein
MVTCQPPSRVVKGRKHTEVYVDTIFDGEGNIVTIKKHMEKNVHRDTYYYTIFAFVLITGLILYSKSKQ